MQTVALFVSFPHNSNVIFVFDPASTLSKRPGHVILDLEDRCDSVQLIGGTMNVSIAVFIPLDFSGFYVCCLFNIFSLVWGLGTGRFKFLIFSPQFI